MTVECHNHAMLRFVFVKQPAMMFHNDCGVEGAFPSTLSAGVLLATILVLDNHKRKYLSRSVTTT